MVRAVQLLWGQGSRGWEGDALSSKPQPPGPACSLPLPLWDPGRCVVRNQPFWGAVQAFTEKPAYNESRH